MDGPARSPYWCSSSPRRRDLRRPIVQLILIPPFGPIRIATITGGRSSGHRTLGHKRDGDRDHRDPGSIGDDTGGSRSRPQQPTSAHGNTAVDEQRRRRCEQRRARARSSPSRAREQFESRTAAERRRTAARPSGSARLSRLHVEPRPRLGSRPGARRRRERPGRPTTAGRPRRGRSETASRSGSRPAPRDASDDERGLHQVAAGQARDRRKQTSAAHAGGDRVCPVRAWGHHQHHVDDDERGEPSRIHSGKYVHPLEKCLPIDLRPR